MIDEALFAKESLELAENPEYFIDYDFEAELEEAQSTYEKSLEIA